MSGRKATFEKTWGRVQEEYGTGYSWSERGLQAVMYAELLRLGDGDFKIVVEPTWGSARPDLVIVSENRITDIFELKFSPHTEFLEGWQTDTQKLLGYVGNKYPVRLDPKSGQYDDSHYLQVPDDCRLHFVAVARRNDGAAWPPRHERVTRWCGCTGDGYSKKWYIEFA